MGITWLAAINVGTTVNCAVNEVDKPLTAMHDQRLILLISGYHKWSHFFGM